MAPKTGVTESLNQASFSAEEMTSTAVRFKGNTLGMVSLLGGVGVVSAKTAMRVEASREHRVEGTAVLHPTSARPSGFNVVQLFVVVVGNRGRH